MNFKYIYFLIKITHKKNEILIFYLLYFAYTKQISDDENLQKGQKIQIYPLKEFPERFSHEKNPAHGKHLISRPMRIVTLL